MTIKTKKRKFRLINCEDLKSTEKKIDPKKILNDKEMWLFNFTIKELGKEESISVEEWNYTIQYALELGSQYKIV